MKRPRSASTAMTFAVAGGRVLTKEELLRQARKNAASRDDSPPLPAPTAAEARDATARDIEAVFDALAVAGSARGKTWVMHFLKASGHRTERGTQLGHHEITHALHHLLGQGRIQTEEGHGHRVPVEAAALRMQELLASEPVRPWWRWWVWAASRGVLREGEVPAWVDLRTRDDMAGVVRLLLYGGVTLDEYNQAMRGPLRSAASVDVLLQATTQPFMAPLFERMDADLRQAVIAALDPVIGEAGVSPLHDWIEDRLANAPHEVPAHLRFRIAERRLHALDLEGMHAALAGVRGSAVVGLFAAAEHAVHGRWVEASGAFAVAYKALQAEVGRRRGAAPFGLTWVYPLALLAQPDPAAWGAARKFCIAESGSRTPPAHDGWGRWAHAAAVRLGDVRLDADAAIARYPYEERQFSQPVSAAHRLLLAALLGAKPPNWRSSDIVGLLQALVDSRRLWLAHLVMRASARLGFDTPWPEMPATLAPAGFVGEAREAWRDALASITALGDGAAARSGAAVERAAQLYWQLSVDGEGRLKKVSPFERTLGARGWSQPKPLSLAKVKNHPKLAPHDAAVARCIERAPYSSSALVLDEGAAVLSLVRHPAVVFDDAPEQLVELSEALPELEVSRIMGPSGECFSFRIQPPLLAADDGVDGGDYRYTDDPARAERRASLRIVRDTPERARLVRITTAHRRVAELVAQEWAVPVDARSELDAALRVLSEHFQIHSDAAAGREVAGHSRLRARLVPQGDALQLRLVVMPFGEFGPSVTPGVGRERLMAVHEGESLTTRRALADEQAHWQAVLDALPFLDNGAAPDSGWLLDDPEQALRAVEVLPTLPAVMALDWPRGRALRVSAVDRPALGLRVASGRDWFALEGELRVDETRVLGLQQLMELARGSRNRFIALGEGAYLALSDSLRQQLADLEAAGRADQGTLKLPAAAAAWLEETLQGASVSGDPGWTGRIAALAQAAELDPVVDGVQAELRGYQLEGFAWMARLAHAGLGACLADDMGLGKTVQTLALLSRRAGEGPALVLAPTSVCANWQAEAHRFAPALNAHLYGDLDDAGRQTLVEQAGPQDLVIASYAVAQIDNERLASRAWTTLVLDEAQALKNAATRRARAAARFEAGFRLALTGTPVENHLNDLWSIMNLVNPGLLGTAHQFGERFAGPIEKQRDNAARQRLRRLVSPFLLRRTKAQVLPDLPARTEIIRRVEPSEQERTFLEALRRSASERVEALAGQDGDAASSFHVLAELMRLRRAACDPRLVAPEFGMVGAKLQEFEHIVRELVEGQHRALVFSQFTDFLKLLGQRLREIGVSHQYLDGATPAAERAQRVQAFQRGDGELFLISLKAGGFGLNLTAADYVLIVDPWWNPAAEDQATGRAHRIGQQRPVTVYRLVTAGSIEDRIVTLHHDKRRLAEGILEGQENAEALSAEALRVLLLGP